MTTAGALAVTGRAHAADKIRITLWHAMAATPGEEIGKLIAAFNASQDRIEVIGQFKGVYKDLLTAVAAAWRAGARVPALRSRSDSSADQLGDRRGQLLGADRTATHARRIPRSRGVPAFPSRTGTGF
jgi:hypothetical protein